MLAGNDEKKMFAPIWQVIEIRRNYEKRGCLHPGGSFNPGHWRLVKLNGLRQEITEKF